MAARPEVTQAHELTQQGDTSHETLRMTNGHACASDTNWNSRRRSRFTRELSGRPGYCPGNSAAFSYPTLEIDTISGVEDKIS